MILRLQVLHSIFKGFAVRLALVGGTIVFFTTRKRVLQPPWGRCRHGVLWASSGYDCLYRSSRKVGTAALGTMLKKESLLCLLSLGKSLFDPQQKHCCCSRFGYDAETGSLWIPLGMIDHPLCWGTMSQREFLLLSFVGLGSPVMTVAHKEMVGADSTMKQTKRNVQTLSSQVLLKGKGTAFQVSQRRIWDFWDVPQHDSSLRPGIMGAAT